MDWQFFELHFSPPRTKRYLAHFTGDVARAYAAYEANLRLAQAFMPLLHVLEVALRNSIHSLLKHKLGREDWWTSLNVDEFPAVLREIRATQAKLQTRGESPFPDKIVAELTFGFWTSLFNARYQTTLWRTLRLAFPHCPKERRKRHLISSSLTTMRHVRNRVFHHEPLLWANPTVTVINEQGLGILGWMDPRLVHWMSRYDDVRSCWQTCSDLLRKPGLGDCDPLVSLIPS